MLYLCFIYFKILPLFLHLYYTYAFVYFICLFVLSSAHIYCLFLVYFYFLNFFLWPFRRSRITCNTTMVLTCKINICRKFDEHNVNKKNFTCFFHVLISWITHVHKYYNRYFKVIQEFVFMFCNKTRLGPMIIYLNIIKY